METLLVLLHTQSDETLAKPALETLSAGKELAENLGTGFTVGLVGQNTAKAAEQIGGCGAENFISVQGEDFSQSRYGTDVLAAEALVKESKATVVLAPATSRWSRALPGAAQRMGGRVDTHLTKVGVQDNGPVVTRWYYRQRMVADITREQRPWILTLAPGCYPAWSGEVASPELKDVQAEVPDDCKGTNVTGIERPAEDQQTIRPDAELLFVAGAGWTKKQSDGQSHVEEAKDLILDFLGAAKASLGSSKSLVDMGGEGQAVLEFMTHLHQVGQTGATPRHPKGLATCCHGEEPHVVGWRFIKERRAVNVDANCGWAQGKADVLYVADAFEVMKKVNELLS